MDEILKRTLDRIDSKTGVRQLGKLIGLQSVKQGCEFEIESVTRESEALQKELYGEVDSMTGDVKSELDENMRDLLAAGPVTVNNQPHSNTASKALQYGMAALAAGAALTAPIVAWNLTRKPPDIVQPSDPPTVNVGARFVPMPQPRANQ